MKTRIMSTAFMFIAVATGRSDAADMFNTPLRGTYAPAISAPESASWTGWEGPYFGVFGALPTNSELRVAPGPLLQPYVSGDYRTRVSGAGGGALAGYNVQYGSLVFGGEADLGFARFYAKEGVSLGTLTAGARISTSHLATARARLGFAAGRLLVFATGGVAVTTLKASAFAAVSGANVFEYRNSQTVTGLAAGIGAEFAITDKLNARGEYLYARFGKATYANAVDAKLDVGMARMAVIGKF